MFIDRHISSDILDALSTSPVVLLNGARQTGKSTLAQWIANRRNFEYITLDDFTVLEAVTLDPLGYLSTFNQPVIIDEVQRVPQLFMAIKQLVDKDRKPGQFLLTGSANVYFLPKLSESLAGRIEILTLWTFSSDELAKRKSTLIDYLFSNEISNGSDMQFSKRELLQKIVKGGYPEIHKMTSNRRRNSWFNSYIMTILQRDVKDISRIESIQELPRIFSLVAAQSGSLLNLSSLSRDVGLVMMTLKRYLAILEATFLIQRLPAWYKNIGKRLIKTPKIYLNDTGLLSYLMGVDNNQTITDSRIIGQLIENYVMLELTKQASWSSTQPHIYYYRTTNGKEVDFVLENRAGQIVGIEVKAASNVNTNDFKGLIEISGLLKERFICGIVLYTGQKTVPFGKNLFAVPICTFWKNKK